MPFKCQKVYTSVYWFLLVLVGLCNHAAQTVGPKSTARVATPPQTAPTSGDVMRERISKAKAFRRRPQLNAAI